MGGGAAANDSPHSRIKPECLCDARGLQAKIRGRRGPAKGGSVLQATEDHVSQGCLSFQVRMHIVMKELVVEDPMTAPVPENGRSVHENNALLVNPRLYDTRLPAAWCRALAGRRNHGPVRNAG